MATTVKQLVKSSTVLLSTVVVILAFIFSTFGWRHVESEESTKIIVGAIILVSMYLLMIFELVHRTLATLIGAAVAIAAHDCLVDYVEMADILKWEDLETLALLFGMMIIVGILSTSGLFNYLAVWSYKRAGGRFWLLIVIMSLITATLSALIDNVSTMILMAPTLIKLSELEHVDPRYILMIMVIFCNIGGCATPVGDPPNLIVIGDSLVASLGISFGSFVGHCLPGVLLTIGAIFLYLRLRYKSKEAFQARETRDRQTKRRATYTIGSPVSICNATRVQNSAPSVSVAQLHKQYAIELKLIKSFRDDLVEMGKSSPPGCEPSSTPIKLELDRRILAIETVLATNDLQNHSGGSPSYRRLDKEFSTAPTASGHPARRGSRLSPSEIDALAQLYSIKDWPVLLASLLVLLAAILLFFAQSIPDSRLTLGWISLFAGLTLMVVTASKDNFEHVLQSIEWSTLIFFFALFIVMETMSKLGLIAFLGSQVTNLIHLIPEGPLRTVGAITIVLWASGAASALIDNVPFTSMMIKILGTMIDQQSGPSMKLLVFALVFGACYGGNGTIIGASANLVTAGISSQSGYPITFNGFVRFCAPITILSLVVANMYLVAVAILTSSY